MRYCLTRLGVGLNVAPSIMKTVLQTVAKQDPVVWEAVSLYIDDVLVNENVISAEQVSEELRSGMQAGSASAEWRESSGPEGVSRRRGLTVEAGQPCGERVYADEARSILSVQPSHGSSSRMWLVTTICIISEKTC